MMVYRRTKSKFKFVRSGHLSDWNSFPFHFLSPMNLIIWFFEYSMPIPYPLYLLFLEKGDKDPHTLFTRVYSIVILSQGERRVLQILTKTFSCFARSQTTPDSIMISAAKAKSDSCRWWTAFAIAPTVHLRPWAVTRTAKENCSKTNRDWRLALSSCFFFGHHAWALIASYSLSNDTYQLSAHQSHTNIVGKPFNTTAISWRKSPWSWQPCWCAIGIHVSCPCSTSSYCSFFLFQRLKQYIGQCRNSFAWIISVCYR